MKVPIEPVAARVTVLGSYARALVLTADRIPQAGETLIGRDYRETWGGKGSDMAVQAARLGAHVESIGAVGDDAFGRQFADLMDDEGVGRAHLRVSDVAPTGVGMIIKDEHARNVIVVDMGANSLLNHGDVERARSVIGASAVLLTQLEIPLETALHGMRVAREEGVRTVLNPAPAVDLRDADLSNVDVLTPNETEARVCVGLAPNDPASDEDIGRMLLARGVTSVVMTLGDKGAKVITADAVVTIPARQVEVVDSNGAGDSFNAALAVALAEDRTLADAADFAAAVAGLSCADWETVPSYKSRDQVDAFLAQVSAPASS